MIEIFKLSSLSAPDDLQVIIDQVRSIFYLSSSLKDFSSEDKKNAFFKRWCGDYLTFFPEQFLVMREDQKVLGYLSGCSDSKKAESIVEVPGYRVFSDLFEKYPAHFHINFHPDCRGLGYGSELVQKYCEVLNDQLIKGVHLVTSVGAPNISFYKKLNFNDQIERPFNNITLLFMAKILE